jgi:hypothetical protein
MFFDQLDERNTIVKSVIAFEKGGQVSLAHLENRLSRLWLVQHSKCRFPCPSTKCDDSSMLSSHLDDRNLMIISIILSGQFWVSTLPFKVLSFPLIKLYQID